jgi:hypothetical protein
MKKRGWILYPYSIFHAKIVRRLRSSRFINNPALKYHNLIIGLFFGGTMDKTLTKYHNIFMALKTFDKLE